MPSTWSLRSAALAAALALPGALMAQGSGFDIAYGRWWHEEPAETYTASYYHRLFGAFHYGLGLFHLDDSRSTLDRTQTGGEISLALGRSGGGLYLVAAAGLGMRRGDGNWDAHWSAGAGYGLSLLSFLSVGVEARYRVEDRDVRGFWRLSPSDRRGMVLQGRLAIGFGSSGPPRTGRPGAERFDPPSDGDIAAAAGGDGVSRESAELAVRVVQTALDAMGTPYRWGGNDENGYDCSGLVQYAYGEHGILLPRVSRDQARLGMLVDRRLEALRPGDILAFSASGNGVSHVGLYVGDGTFIHSASSGVRLSRLTASDPEGRWWRQRWVEARRILN